MKIMKRSLSVLLSILMAFSVFSGLTISVVAEDSNLVLPTGLTAVYGQTLADVEITNPEENPAGRWSWINPETPVGNVGFHDFQASFIPEDAVSYGPAAADLTVEVKKADPTYTVPTGLETVCGKTLSDVELPEGWMWDDPTAPVGNIGNDPDVIAKDYTHNATFTPEDTANYNTATEALTITVNNHSIVETVYPPTCTNDGYTVYMCVCGYYRIDDHITALEHAYDDGVHVDPTCEVPGGTLYTCTRPGCSEDEELHTLFIPNESEEPALGHDMGSWYIAPHPTIDGAYVYKRDCSRDGCRHFEYECDEDDNINVYHKVTFFTDYALPEDGYIIAEDGTKLADTTKYATAKVGEDFYVIDGGKIDFEDTPRFEAFRYATREFSEYRVTDWSVSLENITSNLEAHAVYTGLEIYHTVKFVLPDTTQFIEYHSTGATVLHGHAATAPSVDPTKASNATYNYVFTGWDKDFSKVYSNITVTAQFNEVKRNYKLVYHDKDGAVIGSEIFNNGDPAIAYPAALDPYEDDNYSYVFKGAWTLENGASFSLRTLTVPSYCYNEYNEALEGDESVANILKGIIDIYPVYEKTAKTVPVIINVSSTNGDVLNGAVVKVLNSDGLVAASRTIDGTTSVAFNLLAGEYTVSVSYDGETKVEPLTVTADGGSVSFAFEIREYEETPKECGCLCHIPVIGRIYVFFQSLIFKLTGKKTVCCDDMNSSPYASKRGYTV